MNRQGVKSSNIKSIGYDAAKHLLEVEFTNGTVYQYKDVPQDKYNDLVSADSIGRYFMQNIRGKFPTEKQ